MKILGIISIVAALACLGYFIYRIVKIIKGHVIGEEKHKIEGKEKKELLYLVGITSGLFMVACLSLYFVLTKDEGSKWYEVIFTILGSLVFGCSLSAGIGAFSLYYYKPDLDEKQRDVCRYVWPVALALVFIGLWVFTEGVANHLIYPLVSGISFSEGFIRGGEPGYGFKIKFYGLLIVSGALLCYAITDHMTYKKFKKHGLIDSLFLVAFLFGILGARLWYCIVLEPEFYFTNRPSGVGPFYFLFGIVDGGLAVQGGAILGIAAGVTFMLLFRKYIDVRFMMDVAIPTILLAQCIGRWGNFFNQEVYGAVTTREALWYVPTIVKNNMKISGQYRIPLFYIEAMMNLAGYFVIRYLLGKVCKFHIGLGYQAASYIVWYGMVRAILELFRDPEFMYKQSWYIAFGMIGGGLLLMLAFFLIHKMRMDKGLEDKFGEKVEKV